MTFKNYCFSLLLCPYRHHPKSLCSPLNMAHIFMATMVSDLDLNKVDNNISTLASDNAAAIMPVGFKDYMHQSKARLADYTKEPFLVVNEDPSSFQLVHGQLARRMASLLSFTYVRPNMTCSASWYIFLLQRGSGRLTRLGSHL